MGRAQHADHRSQHDRLRRARGLQRLPELVREHGIAHLRPPGLVLVPHPEFDRLVDRAFLAGQRIDRMRPDMELADAGHAVVAPVLEIPHVKQAHVGHQQVELPLEVIAEMQRRARVQVPGGRADPGVHVIAALPTVLRGDQPARQVRHEQAGYSHEADEGEGEGVLVLPEVLQPKHRARHLDVADLGELPAAIRHGHEHRPGKRQVHTPRRGGKRRADRLADQADSRRELFLLLDVRKRSVVGRIDARHSILLCGRLGREGDVYPPAAERHGARRITAPGLRASERRV